mmetsp:Transcript_9387/g.26165  ORF Transcript_9387/g.26165 Transcript_9387/m.26165 type:complete len:239 (+) Transcript_9387:673-1389(+)
MEPEPMPTRRASAPASRSLFAWSWVTTLPPMTSSSGTFVLSHLIISIWYTESPWEESRMTMSIPSAARALARSLSAGRVPIAAPQRRRPFLSSEGAPGGGRSFFDLTDARVIRPTSSPLSLTTGSLPFLDFKRISSSVSMSCDALPVTRSAASVMTSLSFVDRSMAKSPSRELTRPRSLPPTMPVSVTTTDVKPREVARASHSARVASGPRTSGRVTYPSLCALTTLRCATCSSWVML